MLESMTNAFRLPDLRRRILYTLGVLVVFRLAAHVPLPGVNQLALSQIFQSDTAAGDVSRLLNLLTGGALEQFSVVALGVYPYITATIIFQLVTPLFPQLEELQKEGEAGRNKLNKYSYWLTIPLAVLQGVAQVALLNNAGQGNVVAFGRSDILNTVTVLVAVTAGTMFALWLGEQITEQGIGNGVSIIIFGGIVTGIPQGIVQIAQNSVVALLIVLLVTVITVLAIVIIYEGHRRIPVQYGKRVRGMRVYGGQSTYIPLRVNSAGMIPLIFASSLLLFPGMIGGLLSGAQSMPVVADIGVRLGQWFRVQSPVYYLSYFVLVVLFTFFYTDVVFRQQNLAETLQRSGGFIPGIRPGQRTESYLNYVMRRITLAGALFLGLVAVLPFFLSVLTAQMPAQSMIIQSTGLLIVVGVVLDTIKQLEAQLLMRHYEGFIR